MAGGPRCVSLSQCTLSTYSSVDLSMLGSSSTDVSLARVPSRAPRERKPERKWSLQIKSFLCFSAEGSNNENGKENAPPPPSKLYEAQRPCAPSSHESRRPSALVCLSFLAQKFHLFSHPPTRLSYFPGEVGTRPVREVHPGGRERFRPPPYPPHSSFLVIYKPGCPP